MTLLLDTHVWLWMTAAPERLDEQLRRQLEDAATRLLLSAASSWEIAIKHAIGRLELPDSPARFVPDQLRRQGIEGLAVEHAHALRVATLPLHHADPFDRLLVAQSQLLDVPIVTADEQLAAYDVQLVRA